MHKRASGDFSPKRGYGGCIVWTSLDKIAIYIAVTLMNNVGEQWFFHNTHYTLKKVTLLKCPVYGPDVYL